VERVELPRTKPLVDGAFVAAIDLAGEAAGTGGAAVVLSGSPGAGVAGSPALTVTLDLPYPLSQPDRDLWSGMGAVGTLPLGLGGEVTVTDAGSGRSAVEWSPSDGAKAFLRDLFAKLSEAERGDRVRGHLRLAGSVLALGATDVTRWFWLVEKVTHLVVVPHEGGVLTREPARKAIGLSVSRDDLRRGLPSGVTVEDVEPDLEAARAAAAEIFANPAEKRALQLVVDARYEAAGVAVKDGLARVEIDMELLNAANPARDAADRLVRGDIVDGVLTDAASTRPVLDVGGFTEAVRL
jgi:hypothetical protein